MTFHSPRVSNKTFSDLSVFLGFGASNFAASAFLFGDHEGKSTDEGGYMHQFHDNDEVCADSNWNSLLEETYLWAMLTSAFLLYVM